MSARLAQLVERGTFNPEVKGSSPLSGETFCDFFLSIFLGNHYTPKEQLRNIFLKIHSHVFVSILITNELCPTRHGKYLY
jgi:hypothetical protein